MSARLRRQEIKRDEFREGLASAIQFLRENSRLVLGGLAVVALALVAVALFIAFRERREERAQERLNAALRVYEAAVVVVGADPANTEAPTFSSREERDARAREQLEELRADLGGTAAADIATVYLGNLAARQGDSPGARSMWEGFLARQSDHMLAAQVRLNLMALDRAEGRGEELVARLRSMLAEGGRKSLPADLALHQLAVVLEELGREDEAREALQRLVDEHPSSPYAAQAGSRLAALPEGVVPGA